MALGLIGVLGGLGLEPRLARLACLRRQLDIILEGTSRFAEALAVALEQRGAGKIAAVGVASH